MRLQTQHQDWGEISEIQFLSRKLLEFDRMVSLYGKYSQGGLAHTGIGPLVKLPSYKDKVFFRVIIADLRNILQDER